MTTDGTAEANSALRTVCESQCLGVQDGLTLASLLRQLQGVIFITLEVKVFFYSKLANIKVIFYELSFSGN